MKKKKAPIKVGMVSVMKFYYLVRSANHHVPESCLDIPQGCREALTWVDAGTVLSPENFQSQWQTLFRVGECNTNNSVKGELLLASAGSETCSMYPSTIRESREAREFPSSLKALEKEGWYL